MRRTTQIALSILALAAVPALSGCDALREKPGPDGTVYSFGQFDGTLSANPQQVVEATESVLKEQQLHILSSDATGLDGKIVARSALDKEIRVTVKRQGEKMSIVSIHFGSYGDSAMSRDLYEKIKSKLSSS
jgi:hypothetical protein